MLFLHQQALALTLFLFSGSAAAFSNNKKEMPAAVKMGQNLVGNAVAVGVISAAAVGFSLPQSAMAADTGLVLGTPLETKLANFGAASYPVFNSISDVSPIATKFLDFANKKVKADDVKDVTVKAVDGLLAIPDAKVNEYAGVLKQVVYSGVNKNTCVTLSGSKKLLVDFWGTAEPQMGSDKWAALGKKFAPANSAVPVGANGDICLPGTAEASSKLWVAQAELTLSMPKEQATALVTSIKKAGAQATRPSIAALVPDAERVFSKNSEALKMVAAGKDVEPTVIATVQAALK